MSNDERCAAFGQWMQAKWTELHNDGRLHSIVDDETGWTANYNDRSAECPYCGHIVTRPKFHCKDEMRGIA